jgi:O-glycosyl hydrolase
MAVSNVASSNYYSQTALTSPVSVSVALAALKANPKLTLRINDTTENINRNLGLLNAYANNLTAVVQTNTATSINLTEAESIECDQRAIQQCKCIGCKSECKNTQYR